MPYYYLSTHKRCMLYYCTLVLVYLLATMPLLKNRPLPLRTIALRNIARNLELFWKEKWDPELQEVTEASDDILLNLRKDYLSLFKIFILVK